MHLQTTAQPVRTMPPLAAPRYSTPGLTVQWARCEDDVRQAQRLRYRVFSMEMGANLPTAHGAAGLDADAFDPFCDHLLVRVASSDGQADEAGELVGTYRVLPPDAARRAGGLYIDTEFDTTRLLALRPRAVELGRSCVHPSWRSGGVILALWGALCHYMFLHRLETMIGCASVGLKHGPQTAVSLWHDLRTSHLVDPEWQVLPWKALPLQGDEACPSSAQDVFLQAGTPPLIKGYLRCGTKLLGPPALDQAFNTADLPMMLRIEDLTPRYRRHFLGH